jgi:hypothetical protein
LLAVSCASLEYRWFVVDPPYSGKSFVDLVRAVGAAERVASASVLQGGGISDDSGIAAVLDRLARSESIPSVAATVRGLGPGATPFDCRM